MSPVIYAVLVIVVAGLLGGYAGYRARLVFPSAKIDSDQAIRSSSGMGNDRPGERTTDLVLGVVAALCVPIFLSVLQSELFKNLERVDEHFGWNLLSLAAYCLIASFSSRAFMEGISGQVLRQTQAEQQLLNENQQSLKDVVADLAEEKEIHPGPHSPAEDLPSMPPLPAGDQLNLMSAPHSTLQAQPPLLNSSLRSKLSESDQKVISALNSEAYARRSLSGTAKAAGLSKPEASLALSRLEEFGLVVHGQSVRTGSLMYQLTPLGSVEATTSKQSVS